jgi:hypothetical protein
MLVDGKRFPASVFRDELKLGVGQTRIAGQPSNRLMCGAIVAGGQRC